VGSAADPLAAHGVGESGRLQILVAAAFSLAGLAAAHELSETPHARGRIVLVRQGRTAVT
jgi:zinc-binding alcohol dehydrogenase family protein